MARPPSRRTGVFPSLPALPSFKREVQSLDATGLWKAVTVELDPLQPSFEDYRASRFFSLYPESSYPEFLTDWAFNKRGMRAGTDYEYQVPELGIYIRESGSTVVDFLVITQEPYVAIPVQGIYWHPTHGEIFEKDKLIMQRLQNELGLIVIPLDEDDLLLNAQFFVGEALAGRDHSRYAGLI